MSELVLNDYFNVSIEQGCIDLSLCIEWTGVMLCAIVPVMSELVRDHA